LEGSVSISCGQRFFFLFHISWLRLAHQVNAKQTLSNVNKDLRQSGGTPGDPSCQGPEPRPSIQMGCFGHEFPKAPAKGWHIERDTEKQ
jgi:hypothetical protein